MPKGELGTPPARMTEPEHEMGPWLSSSSVAAVAPVASALSVHSPIGLRVSRLNMVT
jgi:hypothetical protein